MWGQSVRGYGPPMPEISRSFGIVITMYADDHGPTRFHARYGGSKARIALAAAEVLAGKLPPRALGTVVERASMHRAELERDWEWTTRHLPLERIAPLG